MLLRLTAAALALATTAAAAQAPSPSAPAPRVQKAEKLKPLKLGGGVGGFGVSQKDWTFELNKRYSWQISSAGRHECDFESPFFATLTVDKIEIEGITLERPKIEEIEFGEHDDSEVEITFTPTQAGEYKWSCRGFEGRGMTGTFIVK